ncbi:ISAs1 family transposase, partial [bacterium]|nr:ISAs1 family transposase [bacterium]
MSLIAQLKTIPDPRSKRGQSHPLWLVLFLALLGSMCGYWGYRPIAQFCQTHRATLCELLDLDPQTTHFPSYSTFRRVFLQVDAQAWVDAFNVWALLHAPTFAGLLWSIDGKSIKCTSVGGNSSAQNFATLVSVYGQQVGVVQLSLMYNAKESEIGVAKQLLQTVTTAPALAQSLPIGFSLDALHAQVETLSLLQQQGGHYLVGLKANQKNLHQQLQHLRQQVLPLSQTHHSETLHGRHTQRTVAVYAAPADLPERWSTAGITRI